MEGTRTTGRSWDWRRLTLAAALPLVLGGTAFVVLQRRADESRRADVRLAELVAAVDRLYALEWRAVARGRVDDGLRADLADHRARAEALLRLLARDDEVRSAHVRSRYLRYRDAIDVELAAIERGDLPGARGFDEARADLDYGAVQATIAETRERILAEARRAATRSRLGALLALLSAAAAIGALAWRARETAHREALALHEQERLRERRQRLEHANAALLEAARVKREFLANVSHELRTPLAGLLGFIELKADGLCPSPVEEADLLVHARACGRSLSFLIDDLLDLSKIESGTMSVHPGRVDMVELFEDQRLLFMDEARAKGLRLAFEAPGAPLEVRADAHRLRQVLARLIGNGLKFTHQGGVVVRASAGDGRVFVEVIDSGIGIARERLLKMFELFTQGDGSATRRYGGTGIGLALSRTFVRLMGGEVTLESEGEGRGTRVCVELPAWTGSAEIPDDADSAADLGPDEERLAA